MTSAPPRHRLPDRPLPPTTAYQVVHDELMLDGNARLNLATFVTTWMEPQAGVLMAECRDKNMIDKDEYPRTAELERRCVAMLADLWHAPDPATAVGCSTTGSSEACMLAGHGAQAALGEAQRGPLPLARGPAQPRHGRQRAGLLGEVLQLLGGRGAPSAHGGRPLPPRPAGRRRALRREHHRGRRGARLDLRRVLRADRRALRGAGRPPGAYGSGHPRPRRRRVRGDGRALPRRGPGVGLPAAPGVLHQHLGAQVRAGLPRAWAGRCGARRRSCPRSWSSG